MGLMPNLAVRKQHAPASSNNWDLLSRFMHCSIFGPVVNNECAVAERAVAAVLRDMGNADGKERTAAVH